MKRTLLAVMTSAFLLLASSAAIGIEERHNERTVYITYICPDSAVTESYNLDESSFNKIERLFNNIEKYLQENITNQTMIILGFLLGIAIGMVIGFAIKHKPVLFKEIKESMRNIKQKRAFILSSGYTKLLIPKILPKFKLHKFRTSWLYNAHPVLSKTIIIDLFPPKVKILKGMQIGMMKRFIGVYIQIPKPLKREIHTIFFGHAKKITSIDIPDIFLGKPKILREKSTSIKIIFDGMESSFTYSTTQPILL